MSEPSEMSGSENDMPSSDTHSSNREKVDPMQAFILDVIRIIPADVFQKHYRLLPSGLFFEESYLDDLISRYQDWHKARTGSEHEKNREKVVKKFFGSNKPIRFYLPEGKSCLKGYILEAQITNPQSLRVPYYLGTPTSSKDALHPSDELFSERTGVEYRSGSAGVEIAIEAHGKTYLFPVDGLRRFSRLVPDSRKLNREFSNLDDGLVEVVKCLIWVIRHSKNINPANEPLRPCKLARGKNQLEVRGFAGFFFYFEKKTGREVFIYHSYGRNLYNLIRDEFAFGLAPENRGRIGSFEIFTRKDALLGSLYLHNKRAGLHGNAIVGFISSILESPNLVKNRTTFWTVATYLEEFITSVQLSQKIEASKVAAYLPKQYLRDNTILANGAWLFVLSRRQVIIDCVSRTLKNRR